MAKKISGKGKKKISLPLPAAVGSATFPEQPIHTVYGGAHLFSAGVFEKLGRTCIKVISSHFPEPFLLASAFQIQEVQSLSFHDRENLRLLFEKKLEDQPKLSASAELLLQIYQRLINKLSTDPVEDYRIDFEDGYGYRSSDEEDVHAENAGAQSAIALKSGTLPKFFGIRLKPLTEQYLKRAERTLTVFLEAFIKQSRGKFPPIFLVTIPKITELKQVEFAVEILRKAEKTFQLPSESLKLELMAEHPAILTADKGRPLIPRIIKIVDSRLQGFHIGVFDFLSALGVAGTFQDMQHPYADNLRYALKISTSGTDIAICDGVTNILPVLKHKSNDDTPLVLKQKEENRLSLSEGFLKSFSDIKHSYRLGFYQGWDVHPLQLIPRYFTAYYFFLKEFESSAKRLQGFLEKAKQANRTGNTFDDAASAFGLLNFFRRALQCGAVSPEEIAAVGINPVQLRSAGYFLIAYGKSE